MAIALFPLSEGETIGSNIGRYAEFVGIEFTIELRRRLFGYLCGSTTRLPAGIAHLAEQTRDYWVMSVEAIIKEHTEYLYATAFAPQQMREMIFQDMLRLPTGKGSPRFTGYKSAENIENFRYCEECLAEWREKGQTPYWRICHQLPGVCACIMHSTILKIAKKKHSRRSVDPTVKGLIDDADEFIVRNASFSEMRAVEDIAKRSAERRLVTDGAELSRRYSDLLKSAGLVGNDGRTKRATLISEWKAYFGAEYCRLTGMNDQRIENWLYRGTGFLRYGKIRHPFIFLAAESVLEHLIASRGSYVPGGRRNLEKARKYTSGGNCDVILNDRQKRGELRSDRSNAIGLECTRIREAWFSLMQVEPPIRATRNAIFEKSEFPSSARRYRKSLVLLAYLVETRESYLERVVYWLSIQASRQRIGSLDDALQLVGLHPQNFTKEQRARIRNFLSASQAWHDSRLGP
ncbi:TniQ family protein [Burkholderia ubonensis]|uniref:TniQ family protein n=1 Tax=Burkholderia ubonensis TaxID=101571 RepID=UPI0009B4512C|nr:TniQ family protein [Burkholderia ubonensis]